jgi:four helix bundle protein
LIQEKCFAFALEIIRLYQQLVAEREFVLSKQLLRSGTSIGANVEEATAAQSRKDFLSKMSIASKESRETQYWLRLLQHSQLTTVDVAPTLENANELVRILTAIVKSTANKIEN